MQQFVAYIKETFDVKRFRLCSSDLIKKALSKSRLHACSQSFCQFRRTLKSFHSNSTQIFCEIILRHFQPGVYWVACL